MELTTRNAGLADLAAMLTEQQTRKVDNIVPAGKMRFTDGRLVVDGAEVLLTEHGVSTTDGIYQPTQIFDEGVANKLGIPMPYMRRLRNEHTALLDANVNGWLEQDQRSFMVRAFRGEDGTGVARALLSDKYKIVDNLDVLTAALEGIRDAGLQVEIDGCDLTERRMQVRLVAPQITAYATTLLDRYRSPFTGQSGKDNPVVFAGLAISNSETGGGAFQIVPRMKVQVCSNGLTVTKDAMRAVHLGGKLDEGVIRWSDSTHQKNVELITAKTVDAVRTFLDADYMQRVIADMEAQAGKQLDKPLEAVQAVAKKMAYTEEVTQGILDHFIKGGDTTAGGVMHAVTSYSQVLTDPDAAQALEESAFRALELAAAN